MYSYMQYEYINLILINLKVYFITFTNSIQATTLVFLIYTLVALLKHAADENKVFAIIINLATYTLIQVIVISL